MSSKAAIKKQVEFYFSNSNFRNDTFLKAAADSDVEGFVPISVLLTFNKLRNMTTEESVVADAVADSELVLLDEDRTRIRRINPLPDNDDGKQRTLYVKGFPLEEPIVTIEEITEIFSAYGEVAFVRLRRDYNSKSFKGSCFVEYKTKVDMEKALAAANVEGKSEVQISFKGKPFACILALEDWLARKSAKYEKRKMSKRSVDRTSSNNSIGDKRKRDNSDDNISYTPGLIVKLSDLPADSSLFQLKELIKEVSEVKFVDYKPGDNFAFVRVASAEDAEKLLASACNHSLKIPNVKGEKVVNDEEKSYWKTIVESSNNKEKKKKHGIKGGRGNKKGRRY